MNDKRQTLLREVNEHFDAIEAKGHEVRGAALVVSHRHPSSGREEAAHVVVVHEGEALPLLGGVEVLRDEVRRRVVTDRRPDYEASS